MVSMIEGIIMSSNFNLNTKNNNEWLTPPELITSLGNFDLDPCSPIIRPWDTASKHYTVEDNGLMLPWVGRVWLNPPYGRVTFDWLNRLAEHKSGIALIFARTETKGFHGEIWNRAKSIFFFKGRLSFYYVTGEKGQPANAPSCLISYSAFDSWAITMAQKQKSIQGKHVFLNAGRRMP